RAVSAWRTAITSGSPKEEAKAAEEVARLVWRPLSKALPGRLTTLYVAPDGALALLPWAALPTGKGERVLLEDCAVALVPHAPFLLQRLAEPAPARASGVGAVLAVGDVYYLPAVGDRPAQKGKGHLPGTARELELLRGLATKGRPVPALSGPEATVAKVSEALAGKRV